MSAAINNILKFLRLQISMNSSPRCLLGKTALVTGAYDGVGYYASLLLASRGCKVIITDSKKLDNTRENIIKETGNQDILAIDSNLCSLASIRNLGNRVNQEVSKLDILIHHATVPVFLNSITEDGFNTVMQVNYLGPFLLTHLLLKPLTNAVQGRIIFPSSNLAFLSGIELQSLQSKQPDSMLDALKIYIDAKMALIMAADKFAIELKEYGTTCNSVHPGFINTKKYQSRELLRSSEFLRSLAHCCGVLFGKTPWEGCQPTTYLAMDKCVEKVTGRFFWGVKPFFKPKIASNSELVEDIWAASEELVKLKSEEKICNLKKTLQIKKVIEEESILVTIRTTDSN